MNDEHTPYRSPAVEAIAAKIAAENHGPHNCGECWFNEHIKTCDGCEQCVPREWLR